MHLNFNFNAVQILWTLTFAALLVLLVVLLGRDRAQRFRWFTASIVLVALRLLTSRLLFNRLAPLTLSTVFLVLGDVAVVITVLVLVELARNAFAGASRNHWITGTLVMLAVGGLVVGLWGPWPAWKTLMAGSTLGILRMMQLVAQKGELLTNVVAIQMGLLIAFRGSRFQGGWRTHVQRIAIGLSTAATAQIAMQTIWQQIAHHAAPHTQAEYERILGLRDKLYNADSAIYVAVLVWWIVCLWFDEPGAKSATDAPAELPSPVEPEA